MKVNFIYSLPLMFILFYLRFKREKDYLNQVSSRKILLIVNKLSSKVILKYLPEFLMKITGISEIN